MKQLSGVNGGGTSSLWTEPVRWRAMASKVRADDSSLSKDSLVDGFKCPSAIAVTVSWGITLVEFRIVKEKVGDLK